MMNGVLLTLSGSLETNKPSEVGLSVRTMERYRSSGGKNLTS